MPIISRLIHHHLRPRYCFCPHLCHPQYYQFPQPKPKPFPKQEPELSPPPPPPPPPKTKEQDYFFYGPFVGKI